MAPDSSLSKVTTGQLIETVRRELNTANACIVELERANVARDAEGALAVVLRIHHAWSVAETAVHLLRRRRALVYLDFDVRHALDASRYFAREALARAWNLFPSEFSELSPFVDTKSRVTVTSPPPPDPEGLG